MSHYLFEELNDKEFFRIIKVEDQRRGVVVGGGGHREGPQRGKIVECWLFPKAIED